MARGESEEVEAPLLEREGEVGSRERVSPQRVCRRGWREPA